MQDPGPPEEKTRVVVVGKSPPRYEVEALFRRMLQLGRREKRSKVSPTARLADPNRIRHRCRSFRENITPSERERRRANWKRSKVGRAHARAKRRRGFQTQTSEQILEALAQVKRDRDGRRLRRRLQRAGFTEVAAEMAGVGASAVEASEEILRFSRAAAPLVKDDE